MLDKRSNAGTLKEEEVFDMAARKRVANWRAAHDLAVNRIAALMAQGEKDKQQIERLMVQLRDKDSDMKQQMMDSGERATSLMNQIRSTDDVLRDYSRRLAEKEVELKLVKSLLPMRRNIAPRHPGPEAYSTMATEGPALHNYKDKE